MRLHVSAIHAILSTTYKRSFLHRHCRLKKSMIAINPAIDKIVKIES